MSKDNYILKQKETWKVRKLGHKHVSSQSMEQCERCVLSASFYAGSRNKFLPSRRYKVIFCNALLRQHKKAWLMADDSVLAGSKGKVVCIQLDKGSSSLFSRPQWLSHFSGKMNVSSIYHYLLALWEVEALWVSCAFTWLLMLLATE